MRIHPVVNVSRIVRYKEQIKGQKKEEGKPVEIKGVEEWEVEKILNKKKIRGVEKYLIKWKEFMAEGDTWEKRENLKNVEELIEEFEQGGIKVRRQEGEVEKYKRMVLSGKYTAKLLYGWDDQKFKEEYLNKLEKNWKKWKGDRQIDESKYLERIEEEMEEEKEKKRLENRTFLRRRNLKRGVISRSLIVDFIFILLSLFSFLFLFNFLFLEQLGLGFISYAVTSVTS